MAISARDELLHVVSTLTDLECERALELLAPLTGNPDPHAELLAAAESALPILKGAWERQTEGADIWPAFLRLRAAVDAAKGGE